MEDNYKKAYKEIIEVLKYVPKENVDQIPKEMLEMFEDEQDKEYVFKVDTTKPFEEQKLLEETKAIFSNIFRDYWANDYQKKKIIEKENADRIEWEKEKYVKYNPKNLFKNRQKNFNNQNINNKINVDLPIVKKENLFKNLINKIFKYLKRFNKI